MYKKLFSKATRGYFKKGYTPKKFPQYIPNKIS
jgi:hypothetical protein